MRKDVHHASYTVCVEIPTSVFLRYHRELLSERAFDSMLMSIVAVSVSLSATFFDTGNCSYSSVFFVTSSLDRTLPAKTGEDIIDQKIRDNFPTMSPTETDSVMDNDGRTFRERMLCLSGENGHVQRDGAAEELPIRGQQHLGKSNDHGAKMKTRPHRLSQLLRQLVCPPVTKEMCGIFRWAVQLRVGGLKQLSTEVVFLSEVRGEHAVAVDFFGSVERDP